LGKILHASGKSQIVNHLDRKEERISGELMCRRTFRGCLSPITKYSNPTTFLSSADQLASPMLKQIDQLLDELLVEILI